MMSLRAGRLLALAWALGVSTVGLVAGCGSKTSSPLTSTGDGSMLYSCATETRAPAYVLPMNETSAKGTFLATLMSSDPAKLVKGNNTWTVQIADSGGAPVPGLTIGVLPYMPDHQHGTTVQAAVTDKGGGLYEITPLYLYMEGFWQVTLSLQPASGASDSTVFDVCIP